MLSGVATSVSSCSSRDARNTATSGSVTGVLARPLAAGSDTLTIGSSRAPTDVAGNALSPASVSVSFR